MKKLDKNLVLPILALPRTTKQIIVLVMDVVFCIISVWLAYYLRIGEFVALSGNALWAAAVSIAIAVPIFIMTGLYRAIFRYNGWPALLAVGRASGIYALGYVSIYTAIGVQDVPRTIGIIQPFLLLFFAGISRAFARAWLGDHYAKVLKHSSRPKVLVYGAGESGRQLVDALSNSYTMNVVGFLDDDSRLKGQILNGKPIYDPNDLPILINMLGITDVLLAMPSISRQLRNVILNKITKYKVAVRTLPSVSDLAQGKVRVSDLRELEIEDLLGREIVRPNYILLAKNNTDKVVMITGAGGSIGSELSKQILSLSPKKLLLIEQNEYALYRINQFLEEKVEKTRTQIVPLIASVQDSQRMQEIMQTWQPHTIYHAAAYKHVPIVEHNPTEGIKNNVFGTLEMAQQAIRIGTADFVFISSDKAVRPTNIMGASKRLAEIILQALADTKPKTKFSMVRFGNVLGSSGSVVPKFRQQILEGGPITLTHPDINRFFMTIKEASQLVIQAGAMAEGGDVFVLDMGKPVKIGELARRMVELSGLKVRDQKVPDGDIEICITGLRPGEKLYEELIIGNNPSPSTHPRIMKASEEFISWNELEPKLRSLELALSSNEILLIRSMLIALVSDYVPNNELVDWLYLEQLSEKRVSMYRAVD